jgi:hemolysin activation/secretion protein
MVESNTAPRFNVATYIVDGSPLLSTNVLIPMFSKHTGTNVGLEEIVKVASDLQLEYCNQGYPAMSVAFAREQITNGIVTLNVAQTAVPQIMVSGIRYYISTSNTEVALSPSVPEATSAPKPMAASATATNAVPSDINYPTVPADPEEMARAHAALLKKMAELDIQEKDRRVHVISTNTGPKFAVEKYLVMGNSVLSPESIGGTITNIDGAFGTNVSFDGIRAAVAELQKAYRERGYVTVSVGLPQQKLTNEMVKVQVTEGWLTAINVTGNRYFSSNNIMRSLPSLYTNTLLNGLIFQAELNRANANQDRQIYPVIGPGPEPGTSELTLKVKDQLPLHGKVELNNQSSPGTPDLRINSSAVYNNLWQLEHSLGVQYGFSPEVYKQGNQGNFFDQPLIANYSTFYRLPLGTPEPIEDRIVNNPDNFGYNEATRKFNLPPLSGNPELTLFASRATIDTGLGTISSENFSSTTTNGTQVTQGTLNESTVHEDFTVNSDIGSRLSIPLQTSTDFRSVFSGGLDYKTYSVSSTETNIFTFNGVEIDYVPTPPVGIPLHYTDSSPVPFTVKQLEYLPLSLRYDASWRDSLGTATFGLGLSANLWHSSLFSKTSTTIFTTNIITAATTNTVYTTNTITTHDKSLQNITGSTQSSGHWVVLNPSFSRTFMFYTNWITSFRADGQWASEPLISNEQFGAGGVNSVRGYREGEVFGDTGWHLSLEQQTPPHVVGYVSSGVPLTIRGSVYTDYAKTYLLDPQGRPGNVELWGTGLGCVASIGPHWEARFLFSVPLLRTSTTEPYQPLFNFALTGQF